MFADDSDGGMSAFAMKEGEYGGILVIGCISAGAAVRMSGVPL